MVVKVFLSHSSKDDRFVREFAEYLERDGEIKTWADHHDIGPGQPFVSKIEAGLVDVDAVLVVLSPDAVQSQWVDREWKAAMGAGISVAPVLCKACKVPSLLAGLDRFDATKNRLDVFPAIKKWLLGQRKHFPPPFHAPARPPLFVGREAELKALRERLSEEGSVVPVQGFPGLGKTTLALEFAHRFKTDFEAVYWLQCVKTDLAALAGELMFQLGVHIEGDLEKILHDLRAECSSKRCLLVLDNVEDEAPGRLIPGGRASVLVTTRREAVDFLAYHVAVTPALFTVDECLAVFRRMLGEEEVKRSEALAKTLFRELGYLPVGILVAAGLIKQDARYTIDSLAKRLPHLEKLRFGRDNVGALLKEAIATTGGNERKLMPAMAVCSPEGFRLGLAAEIAELVEDVALDALQELKSRSLVEELDRRARRYRLHALVRAAAEPSDALRLRHANAVANRFQDWEKNWRECEVDLPDMRQAIAWLIEDGSDQERWELSGQLAHKGYSLTSRIGRLPEALEFCERMVRAADVKGDKWALQRWHGNLALILRRWGRLEEALALLKKQEEICEELGNRDGLQRCYGNQALILQAWGRLEEALALLKKQEEICEELGNRDGLQRCYGNQALILQDWGRLEEALALHNKKEAICEELGNRDSLQISYGNQASILQLLGRLEEALALHKKGEAICEELGNRDSLQRSYGNQALILQAGGRLEEALALLEKKEAICKELGNRQDLANCYWCVADLARARGDISEARTRAEAALGIFTELKMPREIEGLKDLLKEIGRA
jgi:tetratricopeptide (TPR) repeat protein